MLITTASTIQNDSNNGDNNSADNNSINKNNNNDIGTLQEKHFMMRLFT